MSVRTITYDKLQNGAWTPRNDTSVNPVPLDSMPVPALVSSGPRTGSLSFTGTYSKEQAGGLLSQDLPILLSTAQFSALNVKLVPYSVFFQQFSRIENDWKWTVKSPTSSSSPIANQANGSGQLKPVGPGQWSWQLDPTGQAWVDSGYIVKSLAPDVPNVLQMRMFCDGTKWGIAGLQLNNEPAFTPGPAFQNLPLIVTNWTAGLHPQLQWEGINAPATLVMYYDNIQVVASEAPIPMLDPTTF